jgi:hypothetical protein
MPAVVAQRYLACLNAIAALGDKEPCAVFIPETEQQQQQQQQMTETTAAAVSATKWVSPIQAAKGLMECVHAIGQLDSSDSPQLEEQLQNLLPNKAAAAAAAAGGGWVSPVQLAKGFVQSLQAIGQLDSNDSD